MVDSRNSPFTEPVTQAVATLLARFTKARESVVVGFSGGLDSTVLLHACTRVARSLDLSVLARHVHHGLSPNADEWASFCRQVCEGLDIPLHVLHVAVPVGTGEGVEAAARRVRYKSLADCSADWIVLAHHADDQAETILHNLLRGTGVRGAAAMRMARGRILRPLLRLDRDTLLSYARSNQLAWVDDESNANSHYTRNFLRNEVMPLLTARFPRAGPQLAAAAARFSEADALLDDLAALDLGGALPEFPLPRHLFRDLPDARARNLLRAMLAWNCVQPPDERRLKEFVRQLRVAGNDRRPRLDLEHYSLWCETGGVHFGGRP